MKTLVWDDDLLVIADNTILVVDVDQRLNELKGKYLVAALKDLHSSEKQIHLKIVTIKSNGQNEKIEE
jgi:hypothetical protein